MKTKKKLTIIVEKFKVRTSCITVSKFKIIEEQSFCTLCVYCITVQSWTINLRLFESQSSRLSLASWKNSPEVNLQIKLDAFIKITFYILFSGSQNDFLRHGLLFFPSKRRVGFKNFYGKVECSPGCFLLAAKLQSWTWIILQPVSYIFYSQRTIIHKAKLFCNLSYRFFSCRVFFRQFLRFRSIAW